MSYTSITPLLHVGSADDRPFDAIFTKHAAEASGMVADGQAVVVPSFETARRALVLLGLSEDEALDRTTWWEKDAPCLA